MRARLLLLLFAALFLATAGLGGALLLYAPDASSVGSLLMALVLGLGFVMLALREPAPGRACPRCARELDGALAFCARCGEAPPRA